MKGWTEKDLVRGDKKNDKEKAVSDTTEVVIVQPSQPEAAKSASMDEQREAFVADLVERLYPMGKVNHVSNNVLEFTRGKFTYQITVTLK